jgi:phosphoglycolate phosphatase-like HAD superfamily hydrolase
VKHLYLFDIDGTLIESPSLNRFVQAIKNLYGLNIVIKKDYRGFTDRLILMALLKEEGWPDDKIEQALPDLIQELDRVHEELFLQGSVVILPGVRELLTELKVRDEAIGLITGNLEATAKRKLEDVELFSYFSIGGFGSDPHATRADLVKIAIERAGFSNNTESVYVLGDAPMDMWAANEAGVTNSIGVANGYREIQELVDAGAKVTFESLKDTSDVLSALGLRS